MYINTSLEKVIGLRKTLCSNLVNTYERKKRPETRYWYLPSFVAG